MKRYLNRLFILLFLCFLFYGISFSAEKVDLEAAKRAAEYHGELLFETDLNICDHELLYWPSSEPAVYVFTLSKTNVSFPGNILNDNTLLLGAYMVSVGKELEGYTTMVQADRYYTVVVGATTDMPSFIKAHAGLPEHVIEFALMEYPPIDPYWIYGGLFHTLLGSKNDMEDKDALMTEIHLKETVSKGDLSLQKVGTIPSSVENLEWGSFRDIPYQESSIKDPFLIHIEGVKEGKQLLPAREENIKGSWVGCSPAAFYNCLKYLAKRRRVNLGNKGVNYMLPWIATCFETKPSTGGTVPSKMAKGAGLLFRGLGYSSSCANNYRKAGKPGLFLTQFANEINSKYATEIGGGQGIFSGHSTTGVGYWKQGTHMRLIVHDGWKATPNKVVYVKYSGYPANELVLPESYCKFHPAGKKTYKESIPDIAVPETVMYNYTKKWWKFDEKIKSKNNIKSQCYSYEMKYYDTKGKRYRYDRFKRSLPYWKSASTTYKKPKIKAGKVETKYFLIDDNGHLLTAEAEVQLLEGIVGKWRTTFNWADTVTSTGVTNLHMYEDKTFKSDDGGTGTWSLKNKQVRLSVKEGCNPLYTGTLNDKFDKMSGAMHCRKGKGNGTWSAVKISDTPGIVSGKIQSGKAKIWGICKDCPEQ